MNQCWRAHIKIRLIFIFLLAGNEDFHIPILDPLHVKSLVVEAGTPPINLKQALKNLQVHHIISTTKIQRYR